jgi:hypothetical protein
MNKQYDTMEKKQVINNDNKEIYNDVLNHLQDYILYENNIQRALQHKMVNNNSNFKNMSCSHKPEKNFKEKQQIFVPREKDTLFWCFYIMKHGESKYETLYSKNEVFASQLKIEYVEKIRKEKQTIKVYKFDTLSNIESNLVNDKTLSVKTFLTLCAIENINVLIINKKTYYELLMNDTNDIYVIRNLENKEKGQYDKKYGFELLTKEFVNENIKPNLYRVDNIDKPIKAISAYKAEDLAEICQKLGIDTLDSEKGKNKLKKELYEAIIQYL